MNFFFFFYVDLVLKLNKKGTLMTASAHIITAVIGSGVLSLAWATSQLGWIAGPIALVAFSAITWFTSILLADGYRSPDPVTGTRNYTYMEVVKANLGKLFSTNHIFLSHFIFHTTLCFCFFSLIVRRLLSMPFLNPSAFLRHFCCRRINAPPFFFSSVSPWGEEGEVINSDGTVQILKNHPNEKYRLPSSRWKFFFTNFIDCFWNRFTFLILI